MSSLPHVPVPFGDSMFYFMPVLCSRIDSNFRQHWVSECCYHNNSGCAFIHAILPVVFVAHGSKDLPLALHGWKCFMCYPLTLMQRRGLFVTQAENFPVYLLCFTFAQTSWALVVLVVLIIGDQNEGFKILMANLIIPPSSVEYSEECCFSC